MAISIVGVGASVAVASGNVVLTEPSGVAQDDLLVACIGYRSNVAFTLPSGWTLCDESNTGNTSTNSAGVGSSVMAYIIRGASAPDLTFVRSGGNAGLGAIVAYRGVDTAAPFIGATNAVSASSVATLQIPNFSVSFIGGDLIVGMVGGGGDTTLSSATFSHGGTASGATDTTTNPGNDAIERMDVLTTSGADTTLAIADKTFATFGSASGNCNVTMAAAFLHSGVMAVFKAATGAPVYDSKFFGFF